MSDEALIREIPARMIDAWNRGNATEFAAAFTDNADFIAFEGTHLIGRERIVAFHQPLFDGVLRGSHLTGEVKFVGFLTPAIAVLHAIGGTVLPGQAHPIASRDSMQLFVLAKREGTWVADAMLNARRLTLEQQRFADELACLTNEEQQRVCDLVSSLLRERVRSV